MESRNLISIRALPGLLFCAIQFCAGIHAFAQDQTASFWAAVQDRNFGQMKRLIAQGVNLETRNGEGWTPLIAAARAGDFEMAKLLLDSGADASAKSAHALGSTALCFAIR